MARSIAVLVGNGLSIAFNAELGLRSITDAMLQRIEEQSEVGSTAVAAMKAIAAQALPAGANTDEDFEVLVGAFGAEQATLRYMSNLAAAMRPEDSALREALQTAIDFAVQVRDMGISHVLEVIFERSHAHYDRTEGLRAFVEAVVEAFDGRVTFGNLNYDTLLLSGLLETCQGELADMGHGYRHVQVTTEGRVHEVPALRRVRGDFPANRRVTLLQLHGSLTFWAHHEKDLFAKLDTDFLRQQSLWREIREGDVDVRPVVVLANQKDKSAHVADFPFSLAYEMFAAGLRDSDRWLVVGYSFRDACVNDTLRAEYAERAAADKPLVLVVTHGEQPTRHEIERALGWGAEDGDSADWLLICRDGADAMVGSQEWQAFSVRST